MLYHVIQVQTKELKSLLAADILNMDYDADGRVIITAIDHQEYFLLTSKDLVSE